MEQIMNNSVSILEDQDQAKSQYEVACLELVGGHTPQFGLDQEDHRPIPDQFTIECACGDILDILETLTQDTKIEDDFVDIASGLITSLHYVLKRVEKKQDDTSSEIHRLTREFDGSEIKDHQLQQQTNLMAQTEERVEAIETIRDVLTGLIAGRYNHVWHPPRGSHVSDRRSLTMAVVQSRDFIKAREGRKRDALMPEGSRVGFAGGKDFQNIDAIWSVLDRTRTRHPDMVLVHGGAPGAERIAGKWADNRGIKQIVCTPDWKTHAKAAPFRRNDEMLTLDLIGLVAVPGNGITDNLIDKAREKRLAVKIIEA
jgi:hypothetical protein